MLRSMNHPGSQYILLGAMCETRDAGVVPLRHATQHAVRNMYDKILATELMVTVGLCCVHPFISCAS